MSSVTTIVLNWKNMGDTLDCLHSLRAQHHPNHSVVLIDNFSRDGTVDAVRSRFPEVLTIENSSNLGYAEGNNVGIRRALAQGAEFVFVLNNDTTLAPDCLRALLSDLENNPSAAAAGPKILYEDAPEMINFGGGGISDNGLPFHIGVHQPDGPLFSRPQQTSWLTGCAILFRASAILRVGLFEPRFFLLYEDVDWSLRARRLGYTLRWVSGARLWHKESASFGRRWTPAYVYYFSRNRLLFLERNFPKRSLPRLQRHALRQMFHLVQTEIAPQGGGDVHYWRNVVRRGFTDYLLRRFGAREYHWR